MPAIAAGSHVLVTGASGFIAVWCCHQLLERKFKVRATVRSQDKGKYLEQLFQRHADQFSYVICEDLEKPGVFDEAVKGVDAVLHTASPFHFNVENEPLRTLINPAVNGTQNVLKSIHEHGSNVKRVVVTSSFAAVLDSTIKPPYTYTEADWNESSPANTKKLGNEQPGMDAYRASKTLAERSAWEFVETNKPAWDLVTVNPPFVLGPILHQVNAPEKLNTSVGAVWAFWHGAKSEADLPGPAGNVVDVRNVAYVHVESLVRQEAGGNRFASCWGNYSWQQIADATHASSIVPAEWKSKSPKGEAGAGEKLLQAKYDGSKAERVLGVNYYTLNETVDDMAASLVEYEKRGWKGIPSDQIAALGHKD